ncbi:MAG: microcin C ABC transporter permease YejB [Rhodospirillales bacterium]
MLSYIFRRLMLVPLTLFGILVINFAVIQFVPGGPIEQILAEAQGEAGDAAARITGDQSVDLGQQQQRPSQTSSQVNARYRGAQGVDPELIKELERQFGFDKPAFERFIDMSVKYLSFDLGDSYFQDRSVVDLVLEKMPVSISLGLWTFLLTYLISIPLGVRKAVKDGSAFDISTSWIVIIGNAIPSFLFAILLIIIFAGGRYLDWFPLRGMVSQDFDSLTWWQKIGDYLWHMVLPVTSLVIGSFAGMTLLTKNAFLDEINKQYVLTARAKGLTERRVLYGHVFRNAMLLVISGFPTAFLGLIFTGSFLIETIFSLDGLGLLGFEAIINRDYAVFLGTLYAFTLIGVIFGIINDVMYHIVDPRIDFESREV